LQLRIVGCCIPAPRRAQANEGDANGDFAQPCFEGASAVVRNKRLGKTDEDILHDVLSFVRRKCEAVRHAMDERAV